MSGIFSFADEIDDTSPTSTTNRSTTTDRNNSTISTSSRSSSFTSPEDDTMSISSEMPIQSGRKPDLPLSHTSSSVGAIQKKRRRIPVNCLFCRQRKQKCDRKMPCTNCVRKNNSNCVYAPSGKDAVAPIGGTGSGAGIGGDSYSPESIQPALGVLNEAGPKQNQKTVYEDLAEKMGMKAAPPGSLVPDLGKMMTMDNFLSDRLRNSAVSAATAGVSAGPSAEMKKRLDKMESLVLSLILQKEEMEANQHNDTDGEPNVALRNEDDVEDLGESLGMLKLDKKGKSIYHGDTYWGYMFSEITEIQEVLRRIREEFDNAEIFGKQRFESLCQVTEGQQDTSSIPFGGIKFKSSSSDVLRTLPSRPVCEMLIDRFFEAIEPVVHVVHRPSFEYSFELFWKEPENTELLWVSLLLGMLTLALQSYAPSEVPDMFKGKEVESWTAWLNAMELCGFIGKLTFKPSLLNIRVLLLWMLLEAYQSDWNHKSWTSMGVLVRVAQSMGMHRDASWFVMSPFESEERRRLWKTLEYLDCFHSIAQGLPLAIRSHENDVHDPININEKDIMPMYGHLPEPFDDTVRTDSSFSIYRGRLNDIRCEAFTKNLKIEGKVDSMSVEEVWEIDRRLHKLYEGIPLFLSRRADESNIALDGAEIVMQRFMLEMDYLKTIVVLHRSFSSNGSRNHRHQRNREEALNASVTILERYYWLYTSVEAEPVRNKFWLLGSALTFPAFVHAIVFVTVSLINNYDMLSLIERTRYLEALRRTRNVLDCVGTTISCDFRHAAIAKLILSQVDEVAKMNPEDRAVRLNKTTGNNPPYFFGEGSLGANANTPRKSGIMMELDSRDADIHVDILNSKHPSDSSNWSPSKDYSPESLNTYNSGTTSSGTANTILSSNSSIINQKGVAGQQSSQQQRKPMVSQVSQVSQGSQPFQQAALGADATQQQQDGPSAADILSPSAFGDPALFSEAFFGDAYRMQQIVGSEEWDYFMQTMENSGATPGPQPTAPSNL
ncbi:Asg1p [Sugiyamaella lignohabitans]|uniref:Asg1p n=1 Tax=Sugiyamaella lignohabitans TaxID=796027 RepID=A0A167DIG4_9ASCO|nr:Asg1p [Sugiyamaella lignohabitans]ANB12953.1 Asg1p [Sugiyamaella lignohabitans]